MPPLDNPSSSKAVSVANQVASVRPQATKTVPHGKPKPLTSLTTPQNNVALKTTVLSSPPSANLASQPARPAPVSSPLNPLPSTPSSTPSTHPPHAPPSSSPLPPPPPTLASVTAIPSKISAKPSKELAAQPEKARLVPSSTTNSADPIPKTSPISSPTPMEVDVIFSDKLPKSKLLATHLSPAAKPPLPPDHRINVEKPSSQAAKKALPETRAAGKTTVNRTAAAAAAAVAASLAAESLALQNKLESTTDDLEKQLQELEGDIQKKEEEYITSTWAHGNAIRGWDGFSRRVGRTEKSPTGNASGSATGAPKFRKDRPSDRVFSLSSSTSKFRLAHPDAIIQKRPTTVPKKKKKR